MTKSFSLLHTLTHLFITYCDLLTILTTSFFIENMYESEYQIFKLLRNLKVIILIFYKLSLNYEVDVLFSINRQLQNCHMNMSLPHFTAASFEVQHLVFHSS